MLHYMLKIITKPNVMYPFTHHAIRRNFFVSKHEIMVKAFPSAILKKKMTRVDQHCEP
jgi:hypothetical protein